MKQHRNIAIKWMIMGLITPLLFSACKKEEKTTPMGVKYIQHINSGNVLPSEDEYVVLSLLQTVDGDSILYDSRQSATPVIYQAGKGNAYGDLKDMISQLGEGDSASFYLEIDSLYPDKERTPRFLLDKKHIIATIKVISVLDAEGLENFQQELTRNQRESDEAKLREYISSSDKEFVKTDEGVYVHILNKGNGKLPKAGDELNVHYRGTLLDGTEFDSSFKRDKPFSFTLGSGQVIRGWEVGIANIPIGGQAILLIPSHLGYGQGGSGSIPPDANLKFEVEIISAQGS